MRHEIERQWERERAIKRGAYGCQVDQNKHWVLCCQRARFSHTDTKLDSPLYSSKQPNTDTTSSVSSCLCLFEQNNFFFHFFLVSDFNLPISSVISYYLYPLFAPCFQLLPSHCPAFIPFYPSLHHPSVRPYKPPSHWLRCPLHPISLIHNWTALTATEAKQSFN